MEFEIPQNNILNDKLKEITEKRSEAFNMQAMKSLNTEAIVKLFKLCCIELEERGITQVNGLDLT